MTTTTYDIKLRYTLDDKASRGLKGIEGASRGAARASSGLSGSLGRLATVAVGAFGLRAAGSALIGFNSTVEDTKLQIGGMLALAKKTDLTDELKRADKLYDSLQKRAAKLPGTTQEYVTMAGNITQPIIDAGLSMKDLEDLTVNATVAAKALKYDAGLAARDIDQALRGQFHSTDPFAGKVLGSIGYKGEEGRQKYNALSDSKRASELKRALMQKQWQQLAAAQGQTFSGVLSTVQDRLQQTLGKIGLPLFKAISEELGNWNEWMDKNQDKVNEIAKGVGQGLVEGFRMVKNAIAFLVEHKDTLIMLGKIWLAAKVGSMAGNFAASLGGGAGGMLGALRSQVGGKGKGRTGWGDALGPAGAALAGGYMIGKLINDATGASHVLANAWRRVGGVYDEHAEQMEQRFRDLEATMSAMDEAVNSARARFANDASARSSGSYAQLAGGTDYTANQLQRLKDLAAANTQGDAMNGKIRTISADDRDLIAQYGSVAAARDAVQAQFNKRESVRLAAPGAVDSLLQNNMAMLTDYQRQTVDYAAAQEKLMQLVVRALSGTGGPVTGEQVVELLRQASEDPEGKKKNDPMKKPGKVSVTIQRIEVKSDDPDRFVFGMVEAFRDAARNPSSAARGIRGG